jgi:hypothetical protein
MLAEFPEVFNLMSQKRNGSHSRVTLELSSSVRRPRLWGQCRGSEDSYWPSPFGTLWCSDSQGPWLLPRTTLNLWNQLTGEAGAAVSQQETESVALIWVGGVSWVFGDSECVGGGGCGPGNSFASYESTSIHASPEGEELQLKISLPFIFRQDRPQP